MIVLLIYILIAFIIWTIGVIFNSKITRIIAYFWPIIVILFIWWILENLINKKKYDK